MVNKKEYLYDWCIKNNRQDLLESLKKAGADLKKIKTSITYGSKQKLLWYCPECKKKYDTLIKNNSLLPKFYIHECEVYKKTIGQNGYKTKCPVCSSRKLVSGVNDFESFCKLYKTEFAYLLDEWDFEKNFLRPSEIFPNYTKNDIHWKCKNGHEWVASTNNRINTGNGCMQCSEERRKSKAEKTVYFYIKQIFPNAVENYVISNDSQLELDIYIKELSLGIEYDGSFWHNKNSKRDQKKFQICKKNKIDLFRIREQKCYHAENIATECYYLKQDNNKDLNNAILFLFKYIKEHYDLNFDIPDIDWKKEVSNVDKLINAQIKKNSVAKYPLLKKQWHYENDIAPERVYANSNTPYYWICDVCGYGKNKEWHVSPNSRIEDSKNNKINGCPACSNHVLYKGYNDFKTYCNNNEKYKHLLKEWDIEANSKNGIYQDNVKYCDSKIKIHWKCSKCSNLWTATLKNRIIINSGCRVCAGQEIKQGVNDFDTYCKGRTNIERYKKEFNKDLTKLLDEWDKEKNLKENRTIYNTSHGYIGKIWWRCDEGHCFDASPNDRIQKGTGCRYCSNKDVLKGFNDLESFCITHNEENGQLLIEWQDSNNKKPSEVSYGSSYKAKWKCSICGHEWTTEVRKRVTHIQKDGKLYKGIGCDKCAKLQRRRTLIEKMTKGNELFKINPKLAKEWHPDKELNYDKVLNWYRTPDNTSANSKYKAWWKCSICGHEWSAQVKARNKGSGCPECYNRRRKGI